MKYIFEIEILQIEMNYAINEILYFSDYKLFNITIIIFPYCNEFQLFIRFNDLFYPLFNRCRTSQTELYNIIFPFINLQREDGTSEMELK